MPLPIKLFELQDVVLKDPTSGKLLRLLNTCDPILDTNSRNQRNAAAIYYNTTGSFEILHGLLDRIMKVLEVEFYPLDKDCPTYRIEGKDGKRFQLVMIIWFVFSLRSYFLPWTRC